MESSKFQVVIVGGGVSGLTLANALEKANVNYVLLEGREEFAPVVGASIALGPNGNRVMDQIGCYDTLAQKVDPVRLIRVWKDGILRRTSDQLSLSRSRTGYPSYFCDRHFLLATLYQNLQNKDALLLNKRVSRIDHNHKTATVQCKDGSTYTGDVVVGADGVHSIVRDEMFRYLEVNNPETLEPGDKTAMSAEYSCMYGVSSPTRDLDGQQERGVFHQVFNRDISFLLANDKDGRVFWFVFERMDKVHNMPNIPRYTNEDAVALARRCMDFSMNDGLVFADLWQTRLSYTLVPLEEAMFRHWSWGRLACIGDSVHKWTPNIGTGGNNAIESAALMANILHKLASQTPIPSTKEVEEALRGFRERRLPRAQATSTLASFATRLEALKSPKEEFIAFSVIPRIGDYLLNKASLGVVGAESLTFLPQPARAYAGTMPFNQNYGPGTKVSFARRALLALPLLILSYFARTIFNNIVAQPSLQSKVGQSLTSAKLDYGGRSWNLPTVVEPFGLLVSVFSPTVLDIDLAQKAQAITFLTDAGSLWLLWLLESHRRANDFKYLFTIPVLYGIAFQLLGIGVVGPVWFFIHYIQSPLADYAAKDWRLVNVAAAKTVAPAILLGFTLPTLAMYYLPDLTQRLTVNVVWQAFPVVTAALHFLFRKGLVKDTTHEDRIHNIQADMPYTRIAVLLFAGISAAVFNFARFTADESLSTLVFPDWTVVKSTFLSSDGVLDIVTGMRLFLQVDQIACFGAAYLWLAYLIADLKEAEMTSVIWIMVAASAVAGTFLAGPGAVVLLGWWWRENILATKNAKGALASR